MQRALPLSVLAVALAPGCSSQPIEFDLERPAQALLPIDDIGVEDGRPQFRRLFSERLTHHGGVENPGTEMFLHRLADEQPMADPVDLPRLPVARTHVMFVLGYLGDIAPNGMKPYQPTIERLREEDGYRIDYIPVTGAGSSDYNAAIIDTAIREADIADDAKLVMIGYSKGVTDTMHFLVDYPEMATRVDAFVAIAGVVNGTPMADMFPEVLPNSIAAISGADMGDSDGMHSLKRSVQMPWLAANRLPEHPEYFSLCSFARLTNISKLLRTGWEKLAQLDPMNDSQVIFHDQVLPNSTLLGYCNGDHWAIALPFTEMAPGMLNLVDKNVFPRDALFEAMLLYVREALAE